MNNACPECGAVYAVAEKDIGRRIACKKCLTALIVADEGLKREDDAGDVPRRRERNPDEDDRGSKRSEPDEEEPVGRKSRGNRKARSGPGAGELLNKLKSLADVATWLYAFGLLLTIYSFYTPQIDQAKIASREGDLQQAAVEDAQDERDINQRNDGKPSDGDREARKKRKKEYDDKDHPRMSDKKSLAEASSKQASWWNIMYRLIGFAVLAFGSIMYLTGDHDKMRRILGGVTLLLILLKVVGGSMGLAVHMGGGPGAG